MNGSVVFWSGVHFAIYIPIWLDYEFSALVLLVLISIIYIPIWLDYEFIKKGVLI